MKERPILFSGAMVRAILSGAKTQTRRVVSLPHNNPLGVWEPTTVGGAGLYKDAACTIPANEPERTAIWHTRTGDCIVPPYIVGNHLWVRESWRAERIHDDRPPRNIPPEDGCEYESDNFGVLDGKLRPSIFMPRWASRITLEVTGVRVERLQDISAEDCLAEGIPPITDTDAWSKPIPKEPNLPAIYIGAYCHLWDSINAKRAPWSSNPFVWVVEFKRVAQ